MSKVLVDVMPKKPEEGNRERDIDILYTCDRKICVNCHEECRHTTNVNHAANWDRLDGAIFKCCLDDERMGFFEVETEME